MRSGKAASSPVQILREIRMLATAMDATTIAWRTIPPISHAAIGVDPTTREMKPSTV
jgi:hypothetical protein